MAHQWLIRPEAIDLHPYAGPKVLCGYPDCPGAADLRVGFPFQDPILYCTEHASATIHRATGQDVSLEALFEAATERERRVERGYWRHIHWPVMGRVDEMVEDVGGSETPRRDQGVCGAYVRVELMARERVQVTCPRC